jgi:alanyl-tRNA synthetase
MKYLGKIIGHVCVLKDGIISKNNEIKLVINRKYRKDLKMHHTATHILHAVMRDILGRHVTQKGSLVARDKLRFDFSHPKSLTKAEIRLIEEKVNHIISHNSKVTTKLMSADQAIDSGAMALFGEKYDSEVRVVSLGPDNKEKNPYSFELCGGTHVKRAGDIGAFKITSESAIAAGIRRIEAVCGEFAFANIVEGEELLDKVMDSLKSNKIELVQKIDGLISSKKSLEKQLEKMHMDKMILTDAELEQKSRKIDGARLLLLTFDNIDAKMSRMSAENLAKSHDDLVIVYVSKSSNKLAIVVAVSKPVSDKYNAGNIAKEASSVVGGSGGGQATLAQAGGTDVSKLAQLEERVIALVS